MYISVIPVILIYDRIHATLLTNFKLKIVDAFILVKMVQILTDFNMVYHTYTFDNFH